MTTFDASTVVLSDPAPEFTDRLAERAMTVYSSGAVSADIAAAAARSLPVDAVGEPTAAEAAWADLIAASAGFPLIGTGRVAPTYPALMWNGARLAAAAPDRRWAPLLAALAVAPADTGVERIGRAVVAGLRVLDEADDLLGAAPLAYPTAATLAAAAAASLTGPAEGADLAPVLDLAASLQVFTPAAAHARTDGWAAGHAAAAGWLAATLPADAITAMPGSVAHTASAAAGRPVADRIDVPRTVGDLLGRLA
ncbi:hypothetical protein [Gordonia humi]|uniref:MmgE/PrpD family protein n=1 Tax=Gordonia humi TaxID=686429 RepID=A0A840F015_9ACTN|nr:hypothetical protein [Gordonia humi]MBB4137211.1 hypothetical protein [Gordonia humi]